jgi:hypothetical protein
MFKGVKMKLAQTKGMVAPALGVGTGMLASPKIAGISPFFGKYPYVAPVILLFVALALLSYPKARSFAMGLGSIAIVLLVIAIWSKIKGVTTGAPAKEPVKDVLDYDPGWWGIPGGGVPSA